VIVMIVVTGVMARATLSFACPDGVEVT